MLGHLEAPRRAARAVRVDVSKDYLSYLAHQTDGIEMVGTIEQPNSEAIAALKPDLIRSSTVRHEAIYDQLDAIAPTVLAPDLGDTWQDMGVAVTEPARGGDTYLPLSPEQITGADSDAIFDSTYGHEEDTARAKVVGGPLWRTLDAVSNGDVHPTNDDLVSGIGIQARAVDARPARAAPDLRRGCQAPAGVCTSRRLTTAAPLLVAHSPG